MRTIRPALFAAALAAACLSACSSGSAGKTTPTPTTTASTPVDEADAGISGGPAGASPSNNGTLVYLAREGGGVRLYSWKPGAKQPTQLGSFPLAASAKGRRFDQSAAARCSTAAAAGRLDSMNMRIWRTASGTLSGVSFHGYRLTCELGASIATSIATL